MSPKDTKAKPPRKANGRAHPGPESAPMTPAPDAQRTPATMAPENKPVAKAAPRKRAQPPVAKAAPRKINGAKHPSPKPTQKKAMAAAEEPAPPPPPPPDPAAPPPAALAPEAAAVPTATPQGHPGLPEVPPDVPVGPTIAGDEEAFLQEVNNVMMVVRASLSVLPEAENPVQRMQALYMGFMNTTVQLALDLQVPIERVIDDVAECLTQADYLRASEAELAQQELELQGIP